MTFLGFLTLVGFYLVMAVESDCALEVFTRLGIQIFTCIYESAATMPYTTCFAVLVS